MILDSTLRKLQVVLTTAQTTAPMSVVVDWVDNTITTFTPGVTPSLTNGTSAVDILAAPAASTQRKVNGITISNRDTASKVVQVYLNDNGTQYSLTSSTLGVGETLGYTDTQGWYTIDTSGARKGVGASGATGSQGIQGVSGFHGWDGDNGEDAIPIPGPRGLQGLQGPPGPQGKTIIMLDDNDHGDPFPMGGGSNYASVTGGALAGFKNYIINGNCQIAQRAQGALSATFKYGSVDNFLVAIVSGTGVSGVIGQYGLGIASLGFGVVGSWTTGRFASETAIESVDAKRLNGKTVTISAKVYQDTGGSRNFEILVDKPTVADNYTSSTTIATSSAKAVPHDTITSISHTFTLGASDASNGLAVIIRDTATNTVVSKTYIVGSIQLEEGSIATPIENRPYTTESTLCRRYYWKTYNRGVNAGAVSGQGVLFVVAQATSNYLGCGATLPVEMFKNPIVNAYSPTTGTVARCSVDGVDFVVTAGGSQNAVLYYINNVATTVNQFSTVHITAEASIL